MMRTLGQSKRRAAVVKKKPRRLGGAAEYISKFPAAAATQITGGMLGVTKAPFDYMDWGPTVLVSIAVKPIVDAGGAWGAVNA